jgi:hypothetical protein
MNNKLVIITTAITRGDYHEKSLGELYKSNFFQSIELSDIHHIINIDHPIKLRDRYTVDETLKLFDKIIPSEVDKTIILNDDPSFLNAYKNVVDKVVELKLNVEGNVIWWLEDDWQYIDNGYDLLKICMNLCKNRKVAIHSTKSTPFSTFRGGPLMSASYFNNYFNLSKLGVLNNGCDPEKQVCKWLSGLNRDNGNQKIHRDITNDNVIDILYLCINPERFSVSEIPILHYTNKRKFNKGIKFNYHYIRFNNNKILYSKIDVNRKHFSPEGISAEKLTELLNKDNIAHISIKPWSFVDIGRKFIADNGLKKWSTVNNSITYV